MRIFWIDQAGALQEIEFDASVKEMHTSGAEVTNHPVEIPPGGAGSGTSIISDGMQRKPDRITLEAHVSDDPIFLPRTQNRGVTGQVGSLSLGSIVTKDFDKGQTQQTGATYRTTTTQPSANTLQFQGLLERVKDVHQALTDLLGRQIVSLSTSLREYDNLAVIDVGAPRSAAEGRAVMFSIELEGIVLVQSQSVATPVPAQPRGSSATNRGGQPTTPNQPPANSISIARRITGALGLQP